jgi:hypothetical protein
MLNLFYKLFINEKITLSTDYTEEKTLELLSNCIEKPNFLRIYDKKLIGSLDGKKFNIRKNVNFISSFQTIIMGKIKNNEGKTIIKIKINKLHPILIIFSSFFFSFSIVMMFAAPVEISIFTLFFPIFLIFVITIGRISSLDEHEFILEEIKSILLAEIASYD